jgi:hypothetical protein
MSLTLKNSNFRIAATMAAMAFLTALTKEHTYVCIIYIHIRTYYVLTNPPIQSSRSKHFIFLRPGFFFTAQEC